MADLQKVWFITGCSSGFGRELVKVVTAEGHIAVGTVRKQEQVQELEAINPQNVLGVVLDVTNTEQVKEGVAKAVANYGKIDVLVNNAGYGTLGSIEEISDEEARRQFDVNVFGAVDMIRKVLPHMREKRSGHILNITSIAGLNGFPGVGIYNGSKFALEGIGEALAAEVAHLGIKVTNIEPGPFRTEWAGGSATFTASKIDDYAESAQKNMDSIGGVSGNQMGSPYKGAKAMLAVTELDNPPVHLPLGGPAYKRARIKFNDFLKEVDEFEHIGLPTDYTEEELKNL